MRGLTDTIIVIQKVLRIVSELPRKKCSVKCSFHYVFSGNNQRLEFFGDTVLQLIVSDYLFKHFPKHHEGHLSLLRSSLVNNETQALVCGQLGMMNYYIHEKTIHVKEGVVPEVKLKDKADLVEGL